MRSIPAGARGSRNGASVGVCSVVRAFACSTSASFAIASAQLFRDEDIGRYSVLYKTPTVQADVRHGAPERECHPLPDTADAESDSKKILA